MHANAARRSYDALRRGLQSAQPGNEKYMAFSLYYRGLFAFQSP